MVVDLNYFEISKIQNSFLGLFSHFPLFANFGFTVNENIWSFIIISFMGVAKKLQAGVRD